MKFAAHLLSSMMLVFLSQAAFAFPLAQPGQNLLTPMASNTAGYDFEGIVALSNCSGGLIQLETSRDTDLALVLTNGHCYEYGFIADGKVIVDQPSRRRFQLMDSQAKTVGTLNATKVVYATMTKTDMTIYQLQETYAEIKTKYNIRPLMLSARPPLVKDATQILSGYWRKGYSCGIDAIIEKLKEGDWTCEQSFRYSQPGCETIGGTSGSPVILTGTRTVIGVNNTGNENGEACTENNPCEVDSHGNISYQKGYSYGQQTYWLYSCLSDTNQLDLNKPGCLLPH